MKANKTAFLAALSTLFFTSVATAADSEAHMHHHGHGHGGKHAPIGVTGDHVHNKGEFMFSYRFMHMEMDGNRSGTHSISATEIATTVPNRLAGQPMQPPTLRVVPTKMTMDMHMFGLMYAPTDYLTLMVMTSYIEKEMDHVTFAGPTGTTKLGTFKAKSKGFGDTKVTGLISLYNQGIHKIHLNVGVSLPTGSINKKDRVLAPNGMRPELRLPYPMQLGSGTYDLLPGITYQGDLRDWDWGAQYLATIRTGENSNDYTLGNEHNFTAWGGYSWSSNLSTSLRLAYQDIGNIDGSDPKILAPVQTADPNNQGRKRWDIYAGLNWHTHSGHRFALEIGTPIYQDLDGPQLETDWTATAGYQFVF